MKSEVLIRLTPSDLAPLLPLGCRITDLIEEKDVREKGRQRNGEIIPTILMRVEHQYAPRTPEGGQLCIEPLEDFRKFVNEMYVADGHLALRAKELYQQHAHGYPQTISALFSQPEIQR